MTIRFNMVISRSWLDPDDDFSSYEKALEQKLQALNDSWLIRHALINEELLKEMKTALKNEINYCKFHKECLNRLSNEPFYNEWRFTENVESGGWDKTVGDEWTRTNGRIKATIRIIPPKLERKMTKIELKYSNDSEFLTFIDRYNNSLGKVCHLININSIKQRIEDLKTEADITMNKHLYPKWNIENRNLMGLNKLLHIKSR